MDGLKDFNIFHGLQCIALPYISVTQKLLSSPIFIHLKYTHTFTQYYYNQEKKSQQRLFGIHQKENLVA